MRRRTAPVTVAVSVGRGAATGLVLGVGTMVVVAAYWAVREIASGDPSGGDIARFTLVGLFYAVLFGAGLGLAFGLMNGLALAAFVSARHSLLAHLDARELPGAARLIGAITSALCAIPFAIWWPYALIWLPFAAAAGTLVAPRACLERCPEGDTGAQEPHPSVGRHA